MNQTKGYYDVKTSMLVVISENLVQDQYLNFHTYNLNTWGTTHTIYEEKGENSLKSKLHVRISNSISESETPCSSSKFMFELRIKTPHQKNFAKDQCTRII